MSERDAVYGNTVRATSSLSKCAYGEMLTRAHSVGRCNSYILPSRRRDGGDMIH